MPVEQAWADSTVHRNGMTMNDAITESIEIDAPAEEVWVVVGDVERLPGVLTGMTRLDVEGDDPTMRVGLSWTQTRVIRGHSGSETLRVTELEDGARYVTEGGSRGFSYVTTWSVDPIGARRALLTCTFRGIPLTWFARLMMRVFAGSGDSASREAIRTDLQDIAKAVGGPR